MITFWLIGNKEVFFVEREVTKVLQLVGITVSFGRRLASDLKIPTTRKDIATFDRNQSLFIRDNLEDDSNFFKELGIRGSQFKLPKLSEKEPNKAVQDVDNSYLS